MFDFNKRQAGQVLPITDYVSDRLFGVFDRARPTERSVEDSLKGTFEACIRTRAKLFASIATPDMEDASGFTVERQAADGWEPVEPDHPWQRLMHQPSAHRSSYDFWQWIVMARDLTGRASNLLDGVPRQPQLYEVFPAWGRMQPVPSRDGGIEAYVYQRDDGEDIRMDANKVVELVRPNPNTPYESLGMIESLVHYINGDLDAQRFQATAFAEGRPPMMQIVDQGDENPSPETRDEMKDDFERKMAAGDSFWMMPTGFRAESMAIDPQAFQMLEAQGLTHRVIYRVTGIPEAYFDSENANRSNSQSAERKIRRDTIQPLLSEAAQQLTVCLQRAFRSDPGALRIRAPRALQPTPAEREEINRRRIERGVPAAAIMEEEGEDVPEEYEESLRAPRVPRILQALERPSRSEEASPPVNGGGDEAPGPRSLADFL